MRTLLQKNVVVTALIFFSGTLGALTYGCSEEETTGTRTPRDGGGGGGSNDTGTTPGPKDGGKSNGGEGGQTANEVSAAARIAAMIEPGGATGNAAFVEKEGEVEVTLTVEGPPGLHGVHVHQNGSCDDAGAAAGGHFNPTDGGHGHPDASPHHAGDFGNITLDDAGKGTLSLKTSEVNLGDGGTSIIGRAVIVHQNPDDGTPGDAGPGNSGARIGCGVITIAR